MKWFLLYLVLNAGTQNLQSDTVPYNTLALCNAALAAQQGVRAARPAPPDWALPGWMVAGDNRSIAGFCQQMQ